MEGQNIYDTIAARTGGDIYIGVVGPVRTGKSTFIKRFMDTLVIPHIDSTYTVSYTHLDVYKRQGYGAGPGNQTACRKAL